MRIPRSEFTRDQRGVLYYNKFPDGHMYRANVRFTAPEPEAALLADCTQVHVDGKGCIAARAEDEHVMPGGGVLKVPVGEYCVSGMVSGVVGELIEVTTQGKAVQFANPASPKPRLACIGAHTWANYNVKHGKVYTQKCVGPMVCLTPNCPHSIASDNDVNLNMHPFLFKSVKGRFVCKSCSANIVDTHDPESGRSATDECRILSLPCPSERRLDISGLDPEHVWFYDDNNHTEKCRKLHRVPLPIDKIKEIMKDNPHLQPRQVMGRLQVDIGSGMLKHMSTGDMDGLRKLFSGIHDNYNGRSFRYYVHKFRSELANHELSNVVQMLQKLQRSQRLRRL